MQLLRLDIVSGPQRIGAMRLLESMGLPSADLTDGMLEHFFFVGSSSAPKGLIGLELFGEHARSKSVRRPFLLTTTVDQFFARHSYFRIPREEVSEAIRSTREFAEICPASSILMVKSL